MGNVCCRHIHEDDRESTEGLIKINLDFIETLHNPSEGTEMAEMVEMTEMVEMMESEL